ncbi:MAG: FHA domain-containing protein [Myxococcales bacterium]|nr:FHA domain-containing protein [Myxococcales bacterium]MDD9965732.1 FHA domain-containing protein [Myxococcales bacterium]
MIVCPRCSKENQDHYKFCLGCGAELPREQAAPKEFAPPAPAAKAPPVGAPPAPASIGAGGGGAGAFGAASLPAKDKNLQFAATQQGDSSDLAKAAAAIERESASAAAERDSPGGNAAPAAAPSSGVAAAAMAASPAATSVPVPAPAVPAQRCPSCSSEVPKDFKFCGSCGHRMGADAGAPAAPVAAPEPAAPEPAASADPVGTLVLINPDGSEGDSYSLPEASSAVGRETGGLFGADSYLSPVHATFTFRGSSCRVRDEGSLNGVYFKIPRDQPVQLHHGTIFRIGQEIIRFETVPSAQPVDGVEAMGSPNPGYIGRITLVIGRNSHANGFVIPPEGMHIGRERGDVIFPEDGYVSGLHCRIHKDGDSVVLTDVGSSNGTFVRIEGEKKCSSGELLLMGQQLFRLQY